MKSKLSIALLLILSLILTAFAVPVGAAQVESTMILATTTSTQDSGLLDVLIPVFEKKYNTKVKVIAVGSGQAMEMGKKGDADVLLVHSRAAEDEFMDKGFGSERRDVMHNVFLIVGPGNDPAKISGMNDAAAAFKKISEKKAKFISRGDQSGTHKKEQDVWKKSKITPAGSWYIEAGQGMGDTLMMANEMNAYTLADEATYLTWKNKTDLHDMVMGDKFLFNPYGVITVNPKKFPAVHSKVAQAFDDFITGIDGQSVINDFGRVKYGKNLFVPDAIPASKLTLKTTPAAAPAQYTVSAAKASIYTGASQKSKVVAVIKKGTKVEVTGTQGAFYKVKYKGKTAFVLKTAVKK